MPSKAYYISPIDFGWEFLPSVHDFAARLAQDDLDIRLGRTLYGQPRLDRFLADFEQAKELATQVGWEGDFRGDPCVFCIPIENEIVYGFVWKQENNGDTLVVTPTPLPWLNELVLT
ncbi:hypothetical protein G6N82_06805 [Altererythrobacter sp. BO-6]|uniref:hypothetical protein n=1 Tax=Altererythrobacter sp. BO-6 TaxID=2604537 RepID=UPI0013E10E65|nr:hypothetical protein [Altererythrobacter sp. BO-6]QIG53902.1 hypothetical protein G6N82_06805 [Altererythrobacter sp. BO-6]